MSLISQRIAKNQNRAKGECCLEEVSASEQMNYLLGENVS